MIGKRSRGLDDALDEWDVVGIREGEESLKHRVREVSIEEHFEELRADGVDANRELA